ncbi:MAG: M48 family peptidase, partial [Flavobacteriales bacterium]
MDSSILFYIIVGILSAQFILETVLDYLNSKRYKDPVPSELNDVFDASEYEKSQRYKITNYKFGLVTSTFSFLLTIGFLIFGGFEWIDSMARGISDNPIVIALVFFGIIMIGSDLLSSPLSYYQTFVIEEKFGFNKSSRKLFFLDKLKGWLMTIILGGGILALVLWFFQLTGSNFWIYTWGVIALFSIFMNMFYSKLIV